MIKTPARLLAMRTMRDVALYRRKMAEQLKQHKSIEAQIDLLKSRRLIIEDEETAVHVHRL